MSVEHDRTWWYSSCNTPCVCTRGSGNTYVLYIVIISLLIIVVVSYEPFPWVITTVAFLPSLYFSLSVGSLWRDWFLA